MDKRIAELDKVIVSQAKEIAELKVQVSARPISLNILCDESMGGEAVQLSIAEVLRRK